MIELHTMLMNVKKIYECVSTVLSTFFTRYNAMMIMRQILFSHFHLSINLLTINEKELVSNPTFNSNS